jgi:hypothetical protein
MDCEPGSDPLQDARDWVASWLETPILDGGTLDEWMAGEAAPLADLIEPELVRTVAITLERFGELDRAPHSPGWRILVQTKTGEPAPTVGGEGGQPQAGPDPGRKSAWGVIHPESMEVVRAKATVLWARAHHLEPVDERGRPALAEGARPSWIRGWLRYRRGLLGEGSRTREVAARLGAADGAAMDRAKSARLEAWRRAMALWEALGKSEAFRGSLALDGTDLAPVVLPVLAEAIDDRFPEAVLRATLQER